MEDLVSRLITIVQETAPLIWETAIRQALIVGVMDLLVGLLCLIVSLFLVVRLVTMWNRRQQILAYQAGDAEIFTLTWRKNSPEDEEKLRSERSFRREREGYEVLLWLFGVIGCVLLPAGVVFLWGGIGRVLNPSYYAIEILMGLVT